MAESKKKQVRCNKCGCVRPASDFPKGRDFLQNEYIAKCANPDCDNRQSPGGASMRMFGGERPFEYIRASAPSQPLDKCQHQAEEAS